MGKDLLVQVVKEEEALQFDHFTRQDALQLGLLMDKNARNYPDPAAIEITVNGLVVFRYFQEGAIPDSELWLARKRNTVELMHMSSLHFLAWLEENGETMQDRKLDANAYAAGGGGFPIIIRGVGVVGSICASGMSNHLDDHALVVESIKQYLAK